MPKRNKTDKPEGKSKYAKKVSLRRKAAMALGLPENTPWPVIWAYQEKEN